MIKMILIFTLVLLGSGHCQKTYPGGPDPRAEIPYPTAGWCRLASAYPINPQQARLKAEHGWQGLPFEAWRKAEISKMVAEKRAEYLNVPDYLLCGDVVMGRFELFGMEFWRRR